MTSFIIRRMLQVIPTAFVALSILFFVFFLLPGDPATLIAGGAERPIPEHVIIQIQERYGLNDPTHERFLDYWGRTLQWDLGESYISRNSVNELLGEHAINSLRLASWAILIEVLVGLSVGMWSAIRRYSWSDKTTTIATAVASAVPAFVLGFMLQLMFGVLPGPNKLDWPEWARLHTNGIGPDEWSLLIIPRGDQWRYLLLPALTLACVNTAVTTRMMRGSMLEVLNADFMRTATAKGLSRRSVILRHGMRNAMLPVITVLGISLAAEIGVAVLTETTFNWPGIGSRIVEAVDERDLPVMLGFSLAVVLVYLFINLLVDLSYAWFDPRIRLGQEEAT